MEISQIGSMLDLINFYGEKDADKDGRIEMDEFSRVTRYDRNRDSVLSSWEIMEAVNLERSVRIFSDEEISSVRRANESGMAYTFLTHLGLHIGLHVNEDTTIHGITYMIDEHGLYDVGFHDNGQVRRGYLASDAAIGDNRFGRGSGVVFNEVGRLVEARLGSMSTIQGVTYPRGTFLFFDENVDISTDDGKRLFTAVLGEDTIIGVIKYRKGHIGNPATFVLFYENGRVSHGMLAEDTEIQGMTFRSGTEVFFDESGRLTRVRLSEDMTINGILFSSRGDVEFYENGNVASGELEDDAEIQGMTFERGKIEFYEDGRVSAGSIVTGTDDDGAHIVVDVTIDRHGRVHRERRTTRHILHL